MSERRRAKFFERFSATCSPTSEQPSTTINECNKDIPRNLPRARPALGGFGQNLVASESLWGVRFWNAAELDLLKSAKPKPRRKQFSRDPMVYVLKPVLRISTYSLLILFPNLTDYALEVEQVCAAQLPLLNQLQVSLCRAWCRDVCPGGSQA